VGRAVGRRQGRPAAGNFTPSPADPGQRQFQLADGQWSASRCRSSCSSTPRSATSLGREGHEGDDHPTGRGSWPGCRRVGGSRVHWRTRDYYPAAPRCTSRPTSTAFRSGGAFGAQDLTLDFEIGSGRSSRRGVVAPDRGDHRRRRHHDPAVQLRRGGSAAQHHPQRIHVVTRSTRTLHDEPAAGYSNVHERFAVRISNNGEFIHANPSSAGAQGNTNVTTAASTCRRPTRSSTSTPRSTATRWSHGYLDRAVLRRRRHLGLGINWTSGRPCRPSPGAVAVEPPSTAPAPRPTRQRSRNPTTTTRRRRRRPPRLLRLRRLRRVNLRVALA